MKRLGLVLVSAVLAGFACIAAITQFFDKDCSRHFGILSIPQFSMKVLELASMTNMLDCDTAADPFFAACRRLDIALPSNARIYMDGMLGLTNLDRGLLYHNVAYFLFPREIATSLDQPARITRDGFVGRAAQSRVELITNGFDVELAATANTIKGRPLRPDLPLRPLVSPDWFPSRSDALVAFLLPLLTALAGAEFLRVVFPGLDARLRWRERLACGFGLGMMAVAALTLGVKLCGLHGDGLALAATGLGAIFALRRAKTVLPDLAAGWRRFLRNPVAIIGGSVFLLVFGASGVLGLVESDAVAAWMLKAKILHLHAGGEMVRWFSEPRLAHAHFDYPTLVPALHAATFDSIGRVDEHVTKFWPAWMSLLLIGAIASLARGPSSSLPSSSGDAPPRPPDPTPAPGPSIPANSLASSGPDSGGPALDPVGPHAGTGPPQGGQSPWCSITALGPSFFLLALILLPCMRLYVESEGGTMPMTFFAALGLLQCALAQVERDRARLGLGLTLLFGAAMTKFEGVIILASAGAWMLLLPSARPALRLSPGLGRAAVFWLAAALPYFCLRARIPALFYESGWVHGALAHPGATLSNIPAFLLTMAARWFVDPYLTSWTTEGGHFRWVGRWDGFSSLYYHPTLGLAWMALFMTVALWVLQPARRKLILWILLVVVGVLVGLSAVFASFVGSTDLIRMVGYYNQDIAAPRYLFPVLVGWSVTMLAMLFREAPAGVPNS
jgi:hypothetical protein